MKSNLLNKDRKSLVKIHKAMGPRKRLMAFYHHSRLMGELAYAGRNTRFSLKASRSSSVH